jgi:DNA-binding NtrC family response regulator
VPGVPATRGRSGSVSITNSSNPFEPTVLLGTGEVLEPHHLKLALRARPKAEATLGQRVDGFLNGTLEGTIPFEALVEELERALILRASYATKWNQSRTAEMLNLKRDKLRYRMKLYALHPDEGAPTPQK